MLIENLYKLDSFDNDAQKAVASVTLNAQHKIFEGHFPGQPVLPGVCQLQMVKELLERATGQNLFLSEAGNCKFLQMIDPTQTNVLVITIDYKAEGETVACNAVIKSGDAVYLKMNGKFINAG
ncbi:3-hydroxyacyl-ACP dehydratase [Niabella yanshanensis]|uniref:3-hydroxyacyl-ACP dehydratase n=1 Tax=Niabella yanshanensis TaxID=577386 RepID=A0ABZ0W2H2_9BACT|nr:3-hydroxyacyl-ACP dehydratase [Niabella yanshanensis]WQD36749.1 3-hydroxyacyl-ACP dehydratase [Niabella yanshanensis]